MDATFINNFYFGFEFCLSRSDGTRLRDHALRNSLTAMSTVLKTCPTRCA